MSEYKFRVHHLSGELCAELSLPAGALVRDILVAVESKEGPGNFVLLHGGSALPPSSPLKSVGFSAEAVDLQLIQKTPEVRLLFPGERTSCMFGGRKLTFALVGPPGAGKTSLQRSFCQNVLTNMSQTVQDVRVVCDGWLVPVFLWDQKEEFLSRTKVPAMLPKKDAALLVVDLASHDTLEQARQLARNISDHGIVTKVLLGNKLDLASERQVSCEAARQFATDHGFRYFETSAKDGTGVEDALCYAVAHPLEHEPEPPGKPSDLSMKKSKKSADACSIC